jgi:hypothetical protein
MTLSNLKTQYKSILVLFVVSNAINIPLILYRKQIANYFATHTDIQEQEAVLVDWLGYITLFLAAIINIPLMTKLNNMFLFWIYIILFVFFVIIRPIGIFTNTPLAMLAVICATPCIFAMLKMLGFEDTFNAGLFTLLVCGLTIFNENMMYTLYTNVSTYPYFIVYSIFYLLGYIIVMRNQTINIRAVVEYVQETNIPDIMKNKIFLLEMAILFLFVYIRSFTKNYYGGKLIVNNPIQLNKSSGYQIHDKMYEYTLSCWMNLQANGANYNSSSSEFTSVLLYANSVMVAYQAKTNTLRIIIKNKGEKHRFDIQPTLQAWNHLVLMYSNGVFDIFVNGELEDTSTIVPKTSSHELNLGTNKGVLGQICSVTYYTSVISSELIKSIYLALKDKDPPTF